MSFLQRRSAAAYMMGSSKTVAYAIPTPCGLYLYMYGCRCILGSVQERYKYNNSTLKVGKLTLEKGILVRHHVTAASNCTRHAQVCVRTITDIQTLSRIRRNLGRELFKDLFICILAVMSNFTAARTYVCPE